MMLSLVALGLVALLELCIWLPRLWKYRKVTASLVVVAISVTAGALFALWLNPWAFFLLVLSAFRVINLLRIVQGRMHEQYLRRATRLSSWMLIVWQLVIVGAWELTRVFTIYAVACWLILATLQLILAGVLVGSIRRQDRTTRMPVLDKAYSDHELPTLTVAIPARNETDALRDCLESIVRSDYPKLEVLVLDDCSQNKRTAEVIKGFAQAGVRFMPGDTPKDTWLAKNQAYQKLFDESSGELILFCGVDVRFEPGSLRTLVSALLQKNKTMLSIIPDNVEPASWRENQALLMQPIRYAWELGLPRRMFNRPPVLSSCWIIKRKVLENAGGFNGVSRSIVPESYFARVAVVHDGYSFLRSNSACQIVSTKDVPDQLATAIRTRYPQLHRRPELVSLLALIEFVGLLLPFGIFGATLVLQKYYWVTLVSGVTCALLVYFYGQVVKLTYRKFLPLSLLAFPLAVFVDIGVLHYSMWKYEFSEVIWKDRNVCIPVMHVVPHLPKP